VFGVFASTLVLVNFILCITVTPVLLVLVAEYPVFCRCRCFCKGTLSAEDKSRIAYKDTIKKGGDVDKLGGVVKVAAKGKSQASTQELHTIPNRGEQELKDANEKKGEEIKESKDEVAKVESEGKPEGGELELRAVERCCSQIYAPFLLRYRWAVLFVMTILIVVVIYFAAQLEPSEEQLGNIWPDNHKVKVTQKWQAGLFLKGDNRYMRSQVVYGFKAPAMDRDGAGAWDPAVKGEVIWDPDFNLADPAAQEFFLETCEVARKSDFARSVDCALEDLRSYLQMTQMTSDVDMVLIEEAGFVGNLSSMLSSPVGGRAKALSQTLFDNKGKLKVASFDITTQVTWTSDITPKDKLRDAVEAFVAEHNLLAPASLRGLQIASSHTWLDSQLRLVSSSLVGLMVAFPLALVVILLATKSLMVAMVSVVSIAYVVACVIGAMVALGWALGFMESICITVVVGLAVDYMVHYGIAFAEEYDFSAPAETATQRAETSNRAITKALLTIGVSVVGGSISTFGAALFLMLCTIKYLQQFGIFLALVISSSLLVSSTLIPVLSSIFGDLPLECRVFLACIQPCRKKSTEVSVETSVTAVTANITSTIDSQLMTINTPCAVALDVVGDSDSGTVEDCRKTISTEVADVRTGRGKWTPRSRTPDIIKNHMASSKQNL
jgi:hypothetical protein